MNERERILDLVKKGVLSTEEALDLLEGIAKTKDETQIQKAAEEVCLEKKEEQDPFMDELERFNVEDAFSEGEETFRQKEEQDKKDFEQILDKLATEANYASAELDEVNAEIQGLQLEQKELAEQLMELNTKEELDALDEAGDQKRQELETEMQQLEATLDELLEERLTLEAKLKDIRQNQWEQKKEKLSQKLDIPDDWKEQATETLNQVSDKMTEAGTYLGHFLKKTFQSVSETVNDNVEWKDINLRVPGVSSQKFEKTFEFPATQASLLDVKVANGNINFNVWDEPTVKAVAKIKLYGKMNAVSPEAAFEERSHIEVDDEHISFQIPNKRVRADIEFFLPRRIYDHVSIKLLNGNITVSELEVKDIYMKTTNGNMDIAKMDASMIEIESVSGNIRIAEGNIIDSIIETVNGNVTLTATPQNLGISVVRGNIRLTLAEETLRRLNVSSTTGNVKVALPVTLGLEGVAKASMGAIHSRLTEYDVVRQKKEHMGQYVQFRRVTDAIAHIDLTTTTGNIYLKDTDQNG